MLLFTSSLSSLSTSSDPVTERLTCSDPGTVSTQGDQMLRHLHMARLEGLTGEISFTDGRRDNLQIHLVRRGEEDGLGYVGVFGTGRREMELDEDFREEKVRGVETVNVYVTVIAKSFSLQCIILQIFRIIWKILPTHMRNFSMFFRRCLTL